MVSTFYTTFDAPEYIEPIICFTTEKLTIDENYPVEKLPIAKVVEKRQVLLKFPDNDSATGEKKLRRTVLIGENTIFSEDRTQVLAQVTGYPRLEFHQLEESEEKGLKVFVDPLCHLSRNRMKAFINIDQILFNYPVMSREGLYQLLASAGIIAGVDYKQLSLVKDCIQNGTSEEKRILVAQGTEPVAGQDSSLKFQMDIGPLPGELLEDGSIDFRERKIMVPITSGQIIAVKTPPTNGRPGTTVLGERKPQRKGLDIEVNTAGDAVYSPETRQVTATSDGVLSVVKGNIIKVFSKVEIPGDIDYSTGNVESSNCVVVHGSVLPGFRLKTGGDLEIRGSVNSAKVASMSNIVIKGGILGKTSEIASAGDVDIHFIEQGKIRCGGHCVVRKQCYYSEIWSGSSIRCHELSILVGGELVAEGSITAGSVGGPDADPSLLAAGVSAERLIQSRKLMERLKEYKESIIRRLKDKSGTARSLKLQKLRGGVEKMEYLSARINLIPGTGLYSRPVDDGNMSQSAPGENNGREISKKIDIRGVTIDVYGTVRAGTILQIGNRTLIIEQDTSGMRFRLDEDEAQIVGTALR